MLRAREIELRLDEGDDNVGSTSGPKIARFLLWVVWVQENGEKVVQW
jgi:hypothetical protein